MTFDSEEVLKHQMALLCLDARDDETESQQLQNSPLLTPQVLDHAQKFFSDEQAISQYGLIGGIKDITGGPYASEALSCAAQLDPRLFSNTTAPSSAFICGSQGSGKSHTLSCLLY